MSTPQDFFKVVAPIALVIAGRTTMLPETLMAQFADETGFHAEGTWQGHEGWRGKNNLAGISPGGEIGDYDSLFAFADAYVQVITQDAFGFPNVLAQKDILHQCVALGNSQWAGSRYDAGHTGRPGVDLTTIYQNYSQMIEDALNEARAVQHKGDEVAAATETTPSEPTLAEFLNTALLNLGHAYAADEAGQDFYHAQAIMIRHYAKVRGINGVTVGA